METANGTLNDSRDYGLHEVEHVRGVLYEDIHGTLKVAPMLAFEREHKREALEDAASDFADDGLTRLNGHEVASRLRVFSREV